MQTCLLGLGSNLGESEATLAKSITEISALPDVQVVRHSSFQRTAPVGGPTGQRDFINCACVIETRIAPLTLLSELQRIETRHGRERTERWAPRTLDIDLLLYGNEVVETTMLTLPHPRLSFRRFVLAPAVEIAPKMLHPTIGWPIERLYLHLEAASDVVAIVSPSEMMREALAARLVTERDVHVVERPRFATADQFWPALWTTWVGVTAATKPRAAAGGLAYGAAAFPKVSILLDADVAHRGADKLEWSTLVRRPGRGPTLRLQTTDAATIEAEAFAAVDAVWA